MSNYRALFHKLLGSGVRPCLPVRPESLRHAGQRVHPWEDRTRDAIAILGIVDAET